VAEAGVAAIRKFSLHPLSNQAPVLRRCLHSPRVSGVRSNLAHCNPASGGTRPPRQKKEKRNIQALLRV
jgi:hypothetical protein